MLTILNDPSGATGRSRHPWDCSVSMQANVERYVEHGGDARVLLNGEVIDPATDSRMDAPPSMFDEMVVVQRPEGIETAAYVIGALLVVAAYASAPRAVPPPVDAVGKDSPNNRLTGQTNVARAYQAIPDVYGLRRVWPDLIQGTPVVEYIANEKFITEWFCISRGRGTISDARYADTPIADIDGASVAYFQPSTGPNTYAEQNLTLLTEVIESFVVANVNGQELAFEDFTPGPTGFRDAGHDNISTTQFQLTFYNASIFTTLKSMAGTGSAVVETAGGVFVEMVGVDEYSAPITFPAFSETCSVVSFSESGAFITFVFECLSPSAPLPTQQTPIGWFSWNVAPIDPPALSNIVGPFDTPLSCDALRWNVIFLRGLKGSVQIRAEYWKVNSSGTEISGTRTQRDRTYTDNTYDQRFFTETVYPAAGPGLYRIQFERLNAESTTDPGFDLAKLEAVYALRRYTTKTLPGVTVAKVVTKATTEATGFTERKFNVRWQRHVRTLTSTSISASRNFARAMAHVWSLAGESMTELDTVALQAINTELGETSPLLRFDGSFDDSDLSLGERLQRIAFHARCAVWRDGTKWTVTREQAKAGLVPELQLDYRNLAAGGDSVQSYAAHLPASFNGVEVEYVDETTQAKKAYVRLSIASGAVASGTSSNPLKVQMPACATLAQAENRAHLEARRLLYQRTQVNDTAMQDAGSLGLGALVRWVDPCDFEADDYLQAGEVLALAGSVVTLSEAVDFKGNPNARIQFTGVDGAYVGAPVVCTPGADEFRVVLASVPSGIYIANGTTQQASSRYVFAAGLTEAEIEAAGLYVLQSAAPAGARSYAVTLVNYDERLFEFD